MPQEIYVGIHIYVLQKPIFNQYLIFFLLLVFFLLLQTKQKKAKRCRVDLKPWEVEQRLSRIWGNTANSQIANSSISFPSIAKLVTR